MVDNRFTRSLMTLLLVVPLAIATWAVTLTIAEDEALGYTQAVVIHERELPTHTWQVGHEFTQAGTTALTRPTDGYVHEQPVPKSAQEVRWPDLPSQIHEVTSASDDDKLPPFFEAS